MPDQRVENLVGHLFRHEAGKMVAVLTRLLGFGNYETAEDIVQDTLLKAVTVWKFKGIPDNPQAWLYTVAKRKAIDHLRKQKLHNTLHEEIRTMAQSEWTLSPGVDQLFRDHEIEDSQLRMIFACCHPAIPYESQIALTLKTLCGLSVNEIARSFLTTEETITKRLYRAREKIRSENIALEVPDQREMVSRLEVVLHTLYLFFNEGYNSSHPEQLIRQDLCAEAMRLCLLLTRNRITSTPSAHALLALMCLQASRDDARLTEDGELMTLKEQDRKRWNRELIEKGLYYLNLASLNEAEPGEYHIEAAIAAYHAMAESFEQTNWLGIFALYESLARIKPGPVVEMNKAIALGYCQSPEAAIDALLKIKGLEHSHLYYAALGDFYAAMSEDKNAIEAYDKAMELVVSKTEKTLLERKREKLGGIIF